MSINKSGKHWVVQHKDGRLMGRFKSKKAALDQNKAVHAYFSAKKKKKKKSTKRRKGR